MQKIILLLTSLAIPLLSAQAQAPPPTQRANTRFEQLGPILPTPNTFRTASGAPGKDYFQNRADYDIKATLDDTNQKITGSETIIYHNNSGDILPYVWLQLDQNTFRADADGRTTQTSSISEQGASFQQISAGPTLAAKDYGHKITAVRDQAGKPLKYTINQTMMRIDLPQPVGPGKTVTFSVDWNFKIVDVRSTGARGGYEFFPKDGNYIYEIAQWFPRLCAYSDVTGWQNKQFLGQGEFTLIFGNYKLALTVPNDHIVGATGELQNPIQVLTPTQIKRWNEAKGKGDKPGENPVVIVTQAEAEAAEKGKPTGTKTWIYKADNVRDFSFASSRKFIWDALQPNVEGKRVWAMSLYPKEGNPLWGQYSTRLVAHTLLSYSRRTIAYPYPVAYSVHGPVGGMEYPMISFNGARPEADGTYSVGTKNGLIGVIIHEVGHNFFPMIVNSDERQWSWMDEGLNSFMEGLACLEWDANYPARGIDPQSIVPYMRMDSTLQVPIMSSSDNIPRNTFGPNAYSKPATALNILRETVMGRELFDYAFKEYARRWAFKTPEPADFFRTMEDASGVDLDFFWKGWFYSVQPVDQSLVKVDWFQASSQNPEITKAEARAAAQKRANTISKQRDALSKDQTVVAQDSTMKDFYNSYDPYAVTDADKKKYQDYLATLSAEERALAEAGTNFYTLSLKNKGGIPMPVIVRMEFEDGTDSIARFPAEIWRFNDVSINKVIATPKKVKQWTLDPYYEIADINTEDNSFPPRAQPSRFQLFKQQQRGGGAGPNPMQQQRQQSPATPAKQGSGRN
ncbi:M1 family metallopeptidase [Spirosoma sp. KCTC 42546]|uniref:M1 family metallopeptidase n=1 Tax=Spirosoma sp. KCTC 42546 TaxID=2520506 RepID=UPI00115A2381|nr:M1 family metallopeptidase [Spirosoma sp. KCTC 42546]QDK83293.1 M1 family metallopeptidase [Spirosoma sp. KCTC 42546]